MFDNNKLVLLDMYSKLLKDYKKLNDKLSFSHPVEIAVLFSYFYKNGFLSKDKVYKYVSSPSEIIESNIAPGATIVTGKGCCRHNSVMLNNIFQEFKMKSFTLRTGCNCRNISYEKKDDSYISEEEELDILYIINDDTLLLEDKILLINNDYVDKLNLYCDWKYNRENIPINHQINVLSYRNKAYYIDSNNDVFYHYNNNSKRLVYGDYYENVCDLNNKIYSNRKIKNIKRILTLREEDLGVIKEIQSNTYRICLDNVDMFNEFYNEHKDLYEEIVNKVKILKI